MENLELWWASLGTLQKVLWVSASASTLIFIGAWIINMLGHDNDAHLETDSGSVDDVSDGFLGYVLSFKAIIAFILGASWTGLSAIGQGWSNIAVVLISLVAGLIMMGATAFVISMFMKLQYNPSMTMDKTINTDGEVYLTIPAGGGPGGQVEIMVNNSYKIYEAITDETTPISPGEKIVVVDYMENNVLKVMRMNALENIDLKKLDI